MESRFGGLDLADLDAVTVADQPRVAYHTGLAGAKAACDWKQATETVTLFIPVRPGTSSRNMAVQIKPQRLHVAYRGTGGQLVLEAEQGLANVFLGGLTAPGSTLAARSAFQKPVPRLQEP